MYTVSTQVNGMLETAVKMIEDRPDRLVIRETHRPWMWSGASGLQEYILIPVLFLVFLFFGKKTITIDAACRRIEVRGMSSGTSFNFDDIRAISLSRRVITRSVSGSQMYAGTAVNLADLSLELAAGDRRTLLTGYWHDGKLRSIGEKMSVIAGKPLYIEQVPSAENQPANQEGSRVQGGGQP